MGAATPSAPVLVGAPTDPAGPVRLAERAVAGAHRLVRAVGGAAEPAGAAWTVLVPPARTVDTLAGLLAEMTGPPARPDLGRLRAAVVALAAAVDPTRDPAELWGRPADPDQPDPDEPADPDGPAVPGGTGTVPDTVDDGDGSDELRGAVVTIRRSALIAAVAEDRRGHGARSSPHPCTRPECAEPARVFDQLRRHRRRHAQALHAAATTGRGSADAGRRRRAPGHPHRRRGRRHRAGRGGARPRRPGRAHRPGRRRTPRHRGEGARAGPRRRPARPPARRRAARPRRAALAGGARGRHLLGPALPGRLLLPTRPADGRQVR